VTTMIGISRQTSWRRSSATKSKPSISGIIRSSRMTLGTPRAGARAPPVRSPPPRRGSLRFEHAPEELTDLDIVVHDEDGKVAPVLFERRHQPLAVDRLGEIVGGAKRVAQVLVVDDREHDNRDVGDVRVGLERRQDRPAVHSRHHDVQGDRVRPQLPRLSQAFLTTVRGDNRNPSLVRKRCIRSRTAARRRSPAPCRRPVAGDRRGRRRQPSPRALRQLEPAVGS